MKFYDQLCPVALALDEVGERWSLMIVRDLAMSPLRFSDLLVTNPGIGSNLLTQRLRALVERGIVARRTLPPPAASTVYEITDKGRDLLPVVVELARWGARHGASTLEPEVLKEAIESRRPIVLAKGGPPLHGSFAVSVGGASVGIVFSGQDFEVTLAPPRRPQATLRAPLARLAGLALGVVSIEEAIAAGDLVIKGDIESGTALFHRFLTPLPASGAGETTSAA